MSLLKHFLFWLIVTALMTIGFGSNYNDYQKAFYFVTFMLPVSVSTAYFFNYYLVPKFLFNKNYFKFFLYSFYAFIASITFQMLVVLFSFIILANYNYRNLDPIMMNIFTLASTLYLIVFIQAFYLLFIRFQENQQEIQQLVQVKESLEMEFITIRANRVNHQIIPNDIYYIESLADYVKVYLVDKVLITKETISSLEQMLPPYFLRVHRSFLVNSNQIQEYNKTSINILNQDLPISRTYKTAVLEKLDVKVV